MSLRVCLAFTLAAVSCGERPQQAPAHLSFGGGGIEGRGEIWTTAKGADGTTYVGGNFTMVSPTTGGGVPLDTITGKPKTPFPQVDGYVHTVLPDRVGGWYIGGKFTQVGGLARANLAHILANGTVDGAWTPNASGVVYVLAYNGDRVLAGGVFSEIGGAKRSYLAELNASGQAAEWAPSPNGAVHALAVSGSLVYVGGLFDTIGGQSRKNLAALDANGVATSWNPGPDDMVSALALKGTSLYAGGTFTGFTLGTTTITPCARLASFDTSTGNLTNWKPTPIHSTPKQAAVTALAAIGARLYVGGRFTGFAGVGSSPVTRNYLAAFDTASGSLTDWDPTADGAVQAFANQGNLIYAGGDFTRAGGKTRNYLAALDIASGMATDWDPAADQDVHGLAVSGDTIFAGGCFKGLGGVARTGLAAIAPDGNLAHWDPGVAGKVRSLLVDGSKLYVGGSFGSIRDRPCSNLAAIDIAGTSEPWCPQVKGWRVFALTKNAGVLYVGGDFDSVGTISPAARNGLAAFDDSGTLLPWNPTNANGPVTAMVVDAGVVYYAGWSPGGLVAIDGATGKQRWSVPFTAEPKKSIWSLALGKGVLYAGGDFTAIGSLTQSYLAAVSPENGSPITTWAPAVGGTGSRVLALATIQDYLYVGGEFPSVAGQPRNGLALLESSGRVADWSPGLFEPWANVVVHSLSLANGEMDVGGWFTRAGAHLASNYARLEL